jgi:hypothetical protein
VSQLTIAGAVSPPPTVDSLPAAAVARNRAAWVAALRSGEFAQGHGFLRTPEGFCCLGVAVNLRGCTWRPTVDVFDVVTMVAVTASSTSPTSLTPDTARWLGLKTSNPQVVWRLHQPGEPTYRSLMTLNDGVKLTFPEIADVIEDQAPDWDGTSHQARLALARLNVALQASRS